MSYSIWSRNGLGCRFSNLNNANKITEFFKDHYDDIRCILKITDENKDNLFGEMHGIHFYLNRRLSKEDINNIDLDNPEIVYYDEDDDDSFILLLTFPISKSNEKAMMKLSAVDLITMIMNMHEETNLFEGFDPGDGVDDSNKDYPNCDDVPYFGVGEFFPWVIDNTKNRTREDFVAIIKKYAEMIGIEDEPHEFTIEYSG